MSNGHKNLVPGAGATWILLGSGFFGLIGCFMGGDLSASSTACFVGAIVNDTIREIEAERRKRG